MIQNARGKIPNVKFPRFGKTHPAADLGGTNVSMAVVGFMCIVIGIILFAQQRSVVFAYFQRMQASSWTRVTGELTSLENKSYNRELSELKAEYRYSVSGREMTGNNIDFVELRGTDAAKKIAATLQSKKDIDIYYSPNSPQQSALFVGTGMTFFEDLRSLLWPAAFVIAGAWIMLRSKGQSLLRS